MEGGLRIMYNKYKLTHEELLQKLHYCPDTGVFRYKQDGRYCFQKRGMVAGAFVGSFKNKTKNFYRRIPINSLNIPAHILAYFYMTKGWPERALDHIDGNTDNNSWRNIRECSTSENSCNAKLSIANTTGVKGLSIRKDGILGYRARVMKHGETYGRTFNINDYGLDWEAAKQAAVTYITNLRNEKHGEFARHD